MIAKAVLALLAACFGWWHSRADRTLGAFVSPWWSDWHDQGQRLRRAYWQSLISHLGEGVRFHERLKVMGPAGIWIGDGASIASDVILDGRGSLRIGNDALIGFQTLVLTYTHRFAEVSVPIASQGMEGGAVSIGDGAWIGGRVIILPGVEVGSSTIVGAGSVVTKSVPPFAIVAGNPARLIRYRSMPKRGGT